MLRSDKSTEMFKKLQTRKDIDLLIEEKFYEYVSKEMEAGNIRQGLWAKATAQADSATEADIRKKYIGLRVEFLRAEGRLYARFLEELNAASSETQSTQPPAKSRTKQKPPPKQIQTYTALKFSGLEILGLTVVFFIIVMAGLVSWFR